MWSPVNGTRNRVSPIEKNNNNKQNGYSHRSDWDEPVRTPQSTSGIQLLDIERNGKLLPSDVELTRLIRKRKYDTQESHVDNLLSNDLRQKWTPSLSERLRDKTGSHHQRNYSKKRSGKTCKVDCSLDPWGYFFKRIEGHQGTGVLSYFVFLKSMIFLNFCLFLLVLLFIVIPARVDSDTDLEYTTAVTGGDCCSVSTTNTELCSSNYDETVSTFTETSVKSRIQDFIQGTGWMENTPMFYGWYDAVELNLNTINGHYFNYLMPFAYFMTILAVCLVSIIGMTMFVSGSLKENSFESGDQFYFNKVLGGWDYTLTDEATSLLKIKSLYKEIAANLGHQKYMLTQSTRSAGQTCKIYTIRFVINVFILGILGGSGYLIYWVNDWSTDYLLEEEESSGTVLLLVVQFLPSITLTVLNVIVPLFFGILIKLEDYTDNVVVNLTLLRTIALKLASLTVLMVSLHATVTCSTKDSVCNVGIKGSCKEIRCWETYEGQTFYKLMVMDFFVHIIVIFIYELPRKLLTTKCSCSICNKIGPAEFDVPKSVLDLVYTQALCWLGVLYCPLITGYAFFSFFIQFFLKLFSALYTTKPPEKAYKASRSNNFFVIVLMITFVLCWLPVLYSMLGIRPSTGCGPFRIYGDMSVTLNTTFDGFPDWVKNTLKICIVFIFVILCVVIFYLTQRGRAHYARAKMLKQKLLTESKDKQFLLSKLFEQRGEVRKPKPKHNPRPPLDTHRRETRLPAEEDIDTIWG